MAIIKCKMCGGDLDLVEGASTAECEFCGSVQTIPNLDDEKKLIQFERAERLRKQCEFDKAAGIYETIVADFRQEAEAYWGLVLCKFGIEYVDDPGTGKKIPTCHRSSFDSIMEDSDFEQALENADAAARKVYREEAKQIEEIRKGIISVSSNEPPYDIFICYKETAENGERTLDSVLAQDVYDLLTDKGYRVFFSRITLEDKLGMEYEPYIFAALNSAKIMLVFGTDYEYFNAVWVKNEWSRYLKLMAKDKDKHLIPCFKGIDAYDIPKEFARLQAQDLGKVGAIQDLLRGIEKLLPRQAETTTVIQERVVVGGSGDNKIASLLDRGNMALEDGDWAKADSFFEDVLNNDSKNAQAYLGKTLAVEKCRTIDAFIRKRKDASQSARRQTLHLEPNCEHVDEMVKKFSLPHYVQENEIKKLYNFDLRYYSEVEGRQKQYQAEEDYWNNHKWLSKAEKFATGTVAQNLANEKKALFAALADRTKKAEAEETASKCDLQERYAKHLKEADNAAESVCNTGLARREREYQQWQQIAKTSDVVSKLGLAADMLDQLGDYQDSKNLAAHCRNRITEVQAELEAEKERQEVIRAKEEQQKRKRNTRIAVTICAILAVVLAALVVIYTVVRPARQYNNAMGLMEEGKHYEAVTVLRKIMEHKDSTDKIAACAEALRDQGKLAQAALAYGANMDDPVFREKCLALWDEAAVRHTISAGDSHTVAVNIESKVLTAGKNDDDQCDLEWRSDIIAISAGANHTVGLKADGTVVAVGDQEYGKCSVSNWRDIVAVSAGGDQTVGLKADGTVVVTGGSGYGQKKAEEWTDIIAVSTGQYHIVGLKADGTVVSVGGTTYDRQSEVSEWTDIVAISAGQYHTVGLKADGTVVATGNNSQGQCDVSLWNNIVAVSAGNRHTIGLKSNGSVVAVGNNSLEECEVKSWKNIVAISAGGSHTVGVRADGRVVAVGYDRYGACYVSGWVLKTD